MIKRETLGQIVDSLKQRKPFEAFVVELDSGQRLSIADPAMLGGYGGSYVFTARDGSLTFVESEDVARVEEKLLATAQP